MLWWKNNDKRLPENSEFADMRHDHVILTFQSRHGSMCSQRVANRFYLSHEVRTGM